MKHSDANNEPLSKITDFYQNLYEMKDEETLNKMDAWRKMGAKPKVESIVQLMHDIPCKSVIELGAGFGHILKVLSEIHFAESYTAVDVSEAALEYLENQKIEGVKEIINSSIEKLPYPDKHFDLAILSHVVEHLFEPNICIAEAGRIAKYVLIEVPLEGAIIYEARLWQRRIRRRIKERRIDTITGHVHYFRSKSVKKLIKSAGLKVLNERFYILGEDVLQYNPTRTEEDKLRDQKRLAIVNRYGEQFTARFISPLRFDLAQITHYAVLCQSAE
jgi:ubiquinone/menaquinone biosynthesis C-methylase UbiE